MKKFVNRPETFAREALEGLALAHSDILTLGPEARYVRRRHPARGKVSLVSGGGAGHEPLHAGYVGLGMLDAACPGKIFTSPTPDQIVEAIRAVDGGEGILLIVKNYAGDIMNFELAASLCGIDDVAIVKIADDVSGGAEDGPEYRRGLAGAVVAEKMLGAAAERGWPLNDLTELASRISDNTRSMGVGLTSCVVPSFGSAMFELEDDDVEIGVGIHGERGRQRKKIQPADVLVREMMESIHAELGPKAHGSSCLLLVNGLGATPPAELALVTRSAAHTLEHMGYRPQRFLTGNYATSLDAAGCSITVCLLDAELTELWDAPVHTATLRWGL